ncbi:hypothetical protein [Myroides sp. LJL119]
MQKSIYFLSLLFFVFFYSCDFVLKQEKSQPADQNFGVLSDATPMEQIREDSTCMYEAGYKYSLIFQDCVRPFEIGFRLNPNLNLDPDQVQEENDLEHNGLSCFVVFSDNKDQVEIFLPNNQKGFLLDVTQDPLIYSNEKWKLDTKENFELTKQGKLLFSSASAIEVSIKASDEGL